jgi:hypothetical protein
MESTTHKCICGRTEDHDRRGCDQKALHDRVARIGNVEQFVAWFDWKMSEGGPV